MHGFLGSALSWTDSLGPTSFRLGFELAVTVLGAWLAMHLGRAGRERRRVWRMAIALMFLVTAAEITGAARMAVLALKSQGAEAATPPLADAESAMRKRAAPSGIRPPSRVAESPAQFPWAIWFGRLWLGGTVALVLGICASHLLLARLRRRLHPAACDHASERHAHLIEQLGLGRRIHIGVCSGTQSPFVFGIWRPTLALPERYPPELGLAHRDAILVHELAHLAGRDPQWQFFADLASALIWWHPALWIARAQLRRAAEEAADEASLVLPEGPLFLAESLLAFGRRRLQTRWCAGLTMLGRSRSRLSRRVHILMDLSPAHARGRFLGFRSSAAIVAVVMVTVGSAATRSDLFVEDNMEIRTVWQTSLMGLALTAAWPAEAPAQSEPVKPPAAIAGAKMRSHSMAGKSEEAAAQAVGLSDNALDQFHALLKERTAAMAEFHTMEAGEKRDRFAEELGQAWRDGLQKLLTKEQHGRYVEYWKTNTVSVRNADNGGGNFSIVISDHPLDQNAQLLDGLALSQEQTERVVKLRVDLARDLAKIQKVVQSPDNLGEATKHLAAVQRHRNEVLKGILNAEQYAKYREDLFAAMANTGGAAGILEKKVRIAPPLRP